MIREFLKSTNCMVLIIAVSITFILSSAITACTKTPQEIEYEYKSQHAKILERQGLLKSGLPLAYIECLRKVTASRYKDLCGPLKNK